MKRKINEITIECVQGDITSQDGIEAIVNAANAYLKPGGGVAGAIHRKAGPMLYEECKKLAPIKTSQAVITKAYNLPNKYVIHVLGPVYGKDEKSDEKLAACYKNALKLADEKSIKSIAFPSISTGAFGYPLNEAAEIAIKTVITTTKELKNVKRIIFVLYDSESFKIHTETFDRLTKEFSSP